MINLMLKVIFWISVFCIFWAMIGYGISLRIIKRLKKRITIEISEQEYTVTVMIVAHNEESVIYDKLENVINNDYSQDRIKYIVASDNCDDNTNQIVKNFIESHSDINMTLYITKEHKGKTNAQNEAQKLVNTDILVMTDANSIFEKNAISQLVSSFSDENIVYVCGSLQYVNTENLTAASEASYWNEDLKQRFIESTIKTITAGNGAIYACRNSEYIQIPLIECHDLSMPYYYARQNKRAIYNPNAIAYEKAGETTEDEFKRKVRMNRTIITDIVNGVKVFNIFKYGWFSYFYFGHRTVRYLLWFFHFLALTSNLLLITENWFWRIVCFLQILFYILGAIGKRSSFKVVHMVYYYCITVLAQWVGVINVITGKAEPVWKSVGSTR